MILIIYNHIYNNKKKEGLMIVRVLLLFLSLIILVNLCILAACAICGENLYQKYGKQMLFVFCGFVIGVAALYTALALIGLD